MHRLNSQQLNAIRSIDRPCLVLAGAGSGKTSVITQKIAYLIEQCHIKAKNIVALTFTNKAAREMKIRVAGLLKGKQSYGLTVSTFHSLGLDIIRKELRLLGYRPGFSLFDNEDSKGLIYELIQKEVSCADEDISLILHKISSWKNALIDPRQSIALSRDPLDQSAAQVYEHYQRTLKAYNAVDFDDLIAIPITLFQEKPETLAKWQAKVRYLLVDEYQDTNTCQYELIKLLVGHNERFTVVGDDDQSIYTWRGAKPENLSHLKRDFPGLDVIKLEQNYRSTSRILNTANQLIANNPHEFVKTLWSDRGKGEKIRIIRCKHEEAEAERVALEILTHKLKNTTNYRDYAILYRGNYQSKLIELKLQVNQIPYHISGGTSFFSRAEIKDIMGYLKLLVNPADDNAFLRVINTPRREIGSATLEKLGLYASDRHVSLYHACSEIGLQQYLNQSAIERLKKFTSWIDRKAQACRQGDAMAAIDELVDEIGYDNWLLQILSNSIVAEKRMANINLLIDQLRREYLKGQSQNSIEEAINALTLRDLLDRQAEEDDADRVQLLTLHAAKGLEYPYVFIMGFEEDLLPHRTSIEEDNLQEERRLAYVGITRAKKALCLTLAQKRKQYGQWINVQPSRFIEELPNEELELVNFSEQENVEENKRSGNSALSNLRAMLDS